MEMGKISKIICTQPRGLFSRTTAQGDLDQQREMKEVHWSKVNLDPDRVCHIIYKQVEYVYLIGSTPRHIIMGRNFFRHFLDASRGTDFINQAVSFQFPPEYKAPIQPDWFQCLFAGLHVHCLPWIEGYAVLPGLDPNPPVFTGTRDWAAKVQNQTISVAGEPAGGKDADPEIAREILHNMKLAFLAWMNKPVKRSFLRDRHWWEKKGPFDS